MKNGFLRLSNSFLMTATTGEGSRHKGSDVAIIRPLANVSLKKDVGDWKDQKKI